MVGRFFVIVTAAAAVIARRKHLSAQLTIIELQNPTIIIVRANQPFSYTLHFALCVAFLAFSHSLIWVFNGFLRSFVLSLSALFRFNNFCFLSFVYSAALLLLPALWLVCLLCYLLIFFLLIVEQKTKKRIKRKKLSVDEHILWKKNGKSFCWTFSFCSFVSLRGIYRFFLLLINHMNWAQLDSRLVKFGNIPSVINDR